MAPVLPVNPSDGNELQRCRLTSTKDAYVSCDHWSLSYAREKATPLVCRANFLRNCGNSRKLCRNPSRWHDSGLCDGSTQWVHITKEISRNQFLQLTKFSLSPKLLRVYDQKEMRIIKMSILAIFRWHCTSQFKLQKLKTAILGGLIFSMECYVVDVVSEYLLKASENILKGHTFYSSNSGVFAY